MSSALRTLLATLAITIVLPSERTAALEVFANTGLNNSGVQISGNTPPQYSIAQGFLTGSTAYQIQSVVLGLQVTASPPAPSLPQDYLQFRLHASVDNGSGLQIPAPTAIGSFSSTPVGGWTNLGTATEYTFNYSGTQNLDAGTRYWVVVTSNRAVATTSFRWWYSAGGGSLGLTPTAQNSSGYNSIGTRAVSTDGGPWADASGFSGVRVGVIVVPEPSTYALGTVGVLMMGAVARRKSRKTHKV